MMTFQPRQWSLAPRLGEDQEKQVEDSPSFGRCRPLCRVADSGPEAKVNNPFISAPPSLKVYPRMCGLNPEPDSRPGLSPVNPSSTPGALTSRGRPNKGPADGYLLPEPREQPHQLGLAEVLPGRVRNLPGPQSSNQESNPIWGQLMVQGSQCCNRGLYQSHESSPIKWGLLRSCLRGSKTS